MKHNNKSRNHINEAPVITNQLAAGEKDLIEKITKNITDIHERVQILSMKSENKKLVKENTKKINRLLPYIPTADSTQINNLIYAAAKTIAEMMGKKFENKVKRKKKKEAPTMENKANQQSESTKERPQCTARNAKPEDKKHQDNRRNDKEI